VLVLRPRRSIPRLQGSWYSARCHIGADLCSDVEDDLFPPEIRTLSEVEVRPGGSSPLLLRRDLLEVTLVLEGRLAIVDGLGSGEGRARGGVHVANYGAGLALRRFNESMQDPARFLRVCLPRGENGSSALSVWGSLDAEFQDRDAFQAVMLPVVDDIDANSPGSEAQMAISCGRIRPNLDVVHLFPKDSAGYLVLINGSAQVSTDSDEGTVDAGGACGFIGETSFTIRTRSQKAQVFLFSFRAG
jgi:hypothetical protein